MSEQPARAEADAAVITEHGAPPVVRRHALRVQDPDDVLVRVTAAPIVPLDLLCAGGTSYLGAPALPYVPGVSGTGVVEAGEGPARRVWFNTDAGMKPGDGSLATYAVVPAQMTVPIPDQVADSDAAALGLSAVAAWMALTWRGGLRAGEHVLVLGAGGAVGQVAVQAAVALGAGSVTAATRRAAARGRAREDGATEVVDLSGATVDELTERLRAGDRRFDLVIDPVCGDAGTAALRCLAPHGRLVNLGSAGGPAATYDSAALRGGSQAVLGYTNNALSPQQRAEALGSVLDLAARGAARVAHETVPLTDAPGAWIRVAGAPDRRIVVIP